MDDRESPRKKKTGCGAYCGGSCLGILVLFAVVFAVAYHRAGMYQPRIPPPKPLPVPNAYDSYVQAARMVAASGGTRAMYTSRSSASQISLTGAKAVVQANANALRIVRAAFAHESRNPPDRNIASRSFNELAGLREIARLLSAEAAVRAAEGNHDAAFDCGLDIMEMGEDIHRGGFLIHSLVAIAVQAIGKASMLKSLDRIPQTRIEPLVRRLERIILSEAPIREVMEEERNVMLSHLNQMNSMQALSGGSSPASWWETAFGGISWYFQRAPVTRELENYYAAALPQLDRPAIARKMPSIPRGTISQMMIPVVTIGVTRIEMNRAQNRIHLSALALKGFRLRKGRLPDKLEELRLNPQAITDPYSGAPLVYKPSGGNYLLYSVGPDCADDGGIPSNEDVQPIKGDIGIRSFRYTNTGTQSRSLYRKVPYMRSPKLPPGAPPLPP